MFDAGEKGWGKSQEACGVAEQMDFRARE